MGIVEPDRNFNSKLIISKVYKHYFQDVLLEKVFKIDKMVRLAPITETDENNSRQGFAFFISYAHKDEIFKDELKKHFSGLRRNGFIRDWDGRAIFPGEDWDYEIKQKLEQAHVILFLISSDFMDSDYINDVEIKRAIDRHNEHHVKIIPVIIRPCDFDSLPLKKYQAVPKDKRPISSWENRDEAYLDVVNQIKRIL